MLMQADTDAARLRELGYEPELARTLSVRDLVIHGLIYMVPLAPIGIFGILYNMSAGAVAAVYVIAAVAMLFSAISYKEMAQVFPVSGSTYSYVSLGTNRFLGFVSGWAILLDYLLLPALLCVFSASAMTTIVQSVPAWMWVVFFVAVTAVTNLLGMTITAKMNKYSLYIQLAILGRVPHLGSGSGAAGTRSPDAGPVPSARRCAVVGRGRRHPGGGLQLPGFRRRFDPQRGGQGRRQGRVESDDAGHVHLDAVVRRAGLLRVHPGAERDPLRRRDGGQQRLLQPCRRHHGQQVQDVHRAELGAVRGVGQHGGGQCDSIAAGLQHGARRPPAEDVRSS